MEELSVNTKEEVHSSIIARLGSLVAPGFSMQEYISVQIDDRFAQDAIRRKIHSLYRHKENLTLSKILVCVN